MQPPTAVLFDLDDTLFDHQHCVRTSLIDLRAARPELQTTRIDQLEARYSEALEDVHRRLLAGELTDEAARVERTVRFFQSCSIELDAPGVAAERRRHRKAYDNAVQPVPGVVALLDRLVELGLRLAVVTNHVSLDHQLEKLRRLGLDDRFETISVSGEIGAPKPDPQIFEVTLAEMNLSTEDVVMVGNSLESDVAGAVAAGIRPVWLRRYDEPMPSTPPATIDNDFSDVDASLRKILPPDEGAPVF